MSSDVDALLEQTLWDHYWLPPFAHRVERPEVIYTHCPRDVLSLNMAVKVRAPEAQLPALVAEVREAHSSVESRWLLSPFSLSPALERALSAEGYVEEHHHHACAVDPRAWAPGEPGRVEVRQVSTAQGIRDVSAVAARAFGKPPPELTEDGVQSDLAGVIGPAPRTHRFVAYDRETGEALSSGGMNWFPDLRVCFLWGGGTVPAARGRGAYRAVVDARMKRAVELGARLVGVYAKVDTSAPILEALGFERHGPLVSWHGSASGG